jgi:hypothetical protein
MSVHAIVLVIHIAAVFVLCAAVSVEVLSLVYLRGASTFAEAPLDRASSKTAPVGGGISSRYSIVRSLFGSSHITLGPIVAEGGDCGASLDGSARCHEHETHASGPQSLPDRESVQFRATRPIAKSVPENIAWCSNRGLSRNFFARECQTRPMGVDQPYGSLFNGRSPFIAARLAPKCRLVERPLWDIDDSLSAGGESSSIFSALEGRPCA